MRPGAGLHLDRRRTTWPRNSTSCATCRCASARCRCFRTNALKYNLTWSTDGLINEYCNPCEAIRDGRRGEVPALEELEHFSLDGIEYEAFNTSGGLGTLCDTLEGKVENLNYKTVRYPGHRDIVKMLVRDLRLGMRREILKDVLETAIPITYQDVVLIFVTVSGWRDGLLTQESYAKKIYAQTVGGRLMSAIQITTAAGICAMCDLAGRRQAAAKGFRAAGRSEALRLPRQPLRALLCEGNLTAAGTRMNTMHISELLAHFGIKPAGDHAVHSPIDGAEIGRVAFRRCGSRSIRRSRQASKPSTSGAMCRRRGAASWCGCSARNCAPQGGARPPRHARSRQDPAGRPRRSAGDDRHLRFRGRSVAPALRPDHRVANVPAIA